MIKQAAHILENIAKKQIQPKIGFLQKMFTSQEKRLDGLVDQTMKEMREQGLTPYMAAMTPPIIKNIDLGRKS